MKKTVKTPKKPLSRKKIVKKTAKKRSKTGAEALAAFKLAAVLVVLSLCVSFAVITVHSNFTKAPVIVDPDSEPAPAVSVEPEHEINNDLPVPAEAEAAKSADTIPDPGILPVSVSFRQPLENSQPDPARTAAGTSTSSAASSRRQPEKPPEVSAVNLGTLVFVIDDAGNNLRELEPFLRIAN